MNKSTIDILKDRARMHYTRQFLAANPHMTIDDLTSMTLMDLHTAIEKALGSMTVNKFRVVAGELATLLHERGLKFAFEGKRSYTMDVDTTVRPMEKGENE